ncbi:MAG: penicillin-binding transpeptidase domain-containing protein, partial [Bacteroidota bacterium]
VGISKVIISAYKDKPEKFIDRIRKFDIDKPLGLKFDNEPVPLIVAPGSDNWSMISLPFLSIGYGVKLTPLQLLSFYNSIPCNGKRILPVFERCDTIELPVVLNQNICSSKTLTDARILLDNISDGPLKAAMGPVAFSGHTSVVSNFGGNYYDKSYLMITAAYFPSEKPKYSCIILINNEEMSYPNLSIMIFKDIIDYFN